MHILVTRPEPDASQMKAELEALGHRVSIEPLLRIEPMAIEDRAFEGAQALIATSRNGLRALGASGALASALPLPLFTVGPGTAELARELGFQTVIAGAGTARDLVPVIAGKADPPQGPLVHVAGETLAFDLAAALAQHGFEVRTLTAYRAVAAASLGVATARQIADGSLDAVLLMSPRTAETFAQLVVEAGLKESARRLVFLCLSHAVAEALSPLAPVRTEVADAPNSAAILGATARVATRCRGV
jgi:uroporphyrinogen-III synthase